MTIIFRLGVHAEQHLTFGQHLIFVWDSFPVSSRGRYLDAAWSSEMMVAMYVFCGLV